MTTNPIGNIDHEEMTIKAARAVGKRAMNVSFERESSSD